MNYNSIFTNYNRDVWKDTFSVKRFAISLIEKMIIWKYFPGQKDRNFVPRCPLLITSSHGSLPLIFMLHSCLVMTGLCLAMWHFTNDVLYYQTLCWGIRDQECFRNEMCERHQIKITFSKHGCVWNSSTRRGREFASWLKYKNSRKNVVKSEDI